jgi:hypothetical protein
MGQAVAAPAFNLSTDEFGIVTAVESTLLASELGDAQDVAVLIEAMFAFAGTGSTEINTSLFAITAQGNPNVTALWAHRQSSVDDQTVEASELYQLALVYTTPGVAEFGWQNFDQAQL